MWRRGFGNRGRNFAQLPIREFGKHWQAEAAISRSFGIWENASPVAETTVDILKMERDWIVGKTANTRVLCRRPDVLTVI